MAIRCGILTVYISWWCIKEGCSQGYTNHSSHGDRSALLVQYRWCLYGIYLVVTMAAAWKKRRYTNTPQCCFDIGNKGVEEMEGSGCCFCWCGWWWNDGLMMMMMMMMTMMMAVEAKHSN